MREENRHVMPLWGPYSKKYMGISRIMEESRIAGSRFDLVVYPTYANSAVPVPNVTVPSDYHPWKCDTEGKFFRYRYELQWKDQLYADVDLFEVDEETWGIRVDYHNNTNKIQNCLLNLFAAVEYPQCMTCKPELPEKREFWKALDYQEFSFSVPRPWESLYFDGMRKGEQFRPDFTEGMALAETFYAMMYRNQGTKMFGGNAGDRLIYDRTLNDSYQNAVLTIRYSTYQTDEDVIFDSNYGQICFKACKTAETVTVPLSCLEKGKFRLEMVSRGTEENGVMFDCLCITEAADQEKIRFKMHKRNVIPTITYEGEKVKYEYHYGEKPMFLGILNKRVRSRKLYSGCLEDALITRLTNPDETYDNLTRSFSGAFMEKHSDEGFYHTNVVEAIFLPGQSTAVQYAYVSAKDMTLTKKELEDAWKIKSGTAEDVSLNPEGKEYEFSARMMKTALFSNVVYPIYRHGDNIVHYTPGKRWDSLYTWDSGFIGLGLLEYSKKRAEYVLDTYLSEEDNHDFAFLAHGSLVPTQFYLWNEMMMRSSAGEREKLKKYYPMLQRYYRFMAGKSEGSTMARLKSGMLTVYDYFYNAGGMDDYPPQVAMHQRHLSDRMAPVCSSAHFIRIAKIIRSIALYYGYDEDVKEYEEDIHRVSEALLKNAWDEESGYFGYVLHDPEGMETEIFRTSSGENYNRGVDGVTPLITGVCSEKQEERMLAHLKSEKELWTNVGISTVDQSVSYYRDNGYWNGAVWFPYQYLIWKSMLDIGDTEFACKIAQTALSAWKQETDFSYNTFEMIQIETGRGGWFHQFSGLSAPISVWYHAYYKQGTVTAGFDTWIESVQYDQDHTEARIEYEIRQRKDNCILVVMDSAFEYNIEINGKPAKWTEHVKGAFEIRLAPEKGEVVVRRK